MAQNIREVLDGLQFQGAAESILYSVDTEPWGGSPALPTHDIFDEEDLDISLKASLAPGTVSISSHNLVLPAVTALVAGTIYRVTVTFTSAGNVLQGFFRIEAQV